MLAQVGCTLRCPGDVEAWAGVGEERQGTDPHQGVSPGCSHCTRGSSPEGWREQVEELLTAELTAGNQNEDTS